MIPCTGRCFVRQCHPNTSRLVEIKSNVLKTFQRLVLNFENDQGKTTPEKNLYMGQKLPIE